jgi:hypothetical protein
MPARLIGQKSGIRTRLAGQHVCIPARLTGMPEILASQKV